jgi:hypothetical protein
MRAKRMQSRSKKHLTTLADGSEEGGIVKDIPSAPMSQANRDDNLKIQQVPLQGRYRSGEYRDVSDPEIFIPRYPLMPRIEIIPAAKPGDQPTRRYLQQAPRKHFGSINRMKP